MNRILDKIISNAHLLVERQIIEEDRQMALRYNFIKQKMSQGFYEGISSKDLLYSKAKQIRKQVFEYIASKIEVGDIIFR